MENGTGENIKKKDNTDFIRTELRRCLSGVSYVFKEALRNHME